MKALPFAILALLSLLLQVGAQTPATSSPAIDDGLELLSNADASLTEPSTAIDSDPTDATAADNAPFIEGTLGLPVMRDQLTITESAQEGTLDLEDIDSSYGKMMQDFAATLEDNSRGIGKRAPKRHKLLDILIGFIIEAAATLIVLKVAFLMAEFRYRSYQIVPICLAVALVGAVLNFFFDISLLSPIQIGLNSFIMLMLIRLMTEAHEWAIALQITFVAQFVTIALAWLAFTGMTVFGI